MAKNKKNKNKNSNQNKNAAPKKPVQTEPAEQKAVTQERYVAKRKRDLKRESKAASEPQVKAEEKVLQPAPVDIKIEQLEAVEAEDYGAIFAVTEDSDSVPKRQRPPRFGKKHARKKVKEEKPEKPKKPPEEPKPIKEKPPKAKKPEKKVFKLSGPEFDSEKERTYKEKLLAIREWEEKFMYRLSLAIMIIFSLAVIFICMWKIEVGRISIEGKDEYEISVNMFGIASAIHERSASAMLKEVPIRAGTVEVVVYRIIEDMYIRPAEQAPYDEGEPILMGFYRAERFAKFFESHDFSNGKANMHIRRVTKEDKKNAKKYAINIGRAALIREYTQKYGGESADNFESLRLSPIIEIIDRDAVTREAAKAVADIFSGSNLTGYDIPMVITENPTPAPAVVETPAPAPVQTAAPVRRTTTKSTTTKSTTTSSATTAPKDEAASETAAPAPSMEPSLVTKPVEPVREVSRPTANPVTKADAD